MTEQQDLEFDAAYEREVTTTKEAERLQKAVLDALAAYAEYLDDHGLIWDADITELKVKRLIADIDFRGCEESAYDRTYGITLEGGAVDRLGTGESSGEVPIAEAGLSAQPKAAKRHDQSPGEINHRSAAKCLEGAVGASRHEPRTYVFPGDLYGQENA
jgi:hypothetical protein